MTSTDCDANALIESWAGEQYNTLTLPLKTSITMGFVGGNWFSLLFKGGGLGWSVVCRMNLALRPDGYINTSPVTNTLPVVFVPVNTQAVHVVQMADNDGTDILQCRWSTSTSATNYDGVDECGGVCSGLPPSTVLFSSNCTLVFTLPITGKYYACALQIEDYFNSSSTAPMSSVPIQFLFYAYTPSGSACATRPSIIGDRPNRGMRMNSSLSYRQILNHAFLCFFKFSLACIGVPISKCS
jgi:hypothetical protein